MPVAVVSLVNAYLFQMITDKVDPAFVINIIFTVRVAVLADEDRDSTVLFLDPRYLMAKTFGYYLKINVYSE